MLRKFLVLSLILSSIAFSAVRPPFADGVRPLGMGGTFTALADDYNILMYNPANLSKAKNFQLNIPHIEVETSQKTLDFISYFIDNKDLFSGNLTSWTSATIDKLSSAAIKLNVNTSVSLIGINTPIGNFGTGIFGIVYTNVTTTYDILNINARFESNIDFIVPVSYGTMLEIPGLNQFFDTALGGGRLGVGGTVKIIERMQLIENRSVFEFAGLDPASMLKKLTTPTMGFGIDLGINYYVPSISSTFSLVAKDLMTTIGTDKVNSAYTFGYALAPNFDFLKSFADLTVGLDVVDIFGTQTIMNKLHLGLEVRLLGFLYLRGGAYQGWTSFGVGLGRVLEYANYGIELGQYPGQIEERQHRICLALPF